MNAWHHAQGFTGAALTERVRWQVEGWAQSSTGPTAGITTLTLLPVEVVADEGRQLGFWGGTACGPSGRRAAARLAGLLGPDAVRARSGGEVEARGAGHHGAGGVRRAARARRSLGSSRSPVPGRVGCRLHLRPGSPRRWCRPAWWTSAATPSR